MKTISKSSFISYKTCPKSFWLNSFYPEERHEVRDAQKQIEDGKTVGDAARGYFSDTILVEARNEDGSLNFERMIAETSRLVKEGKNTIAEASFSVDGLFCSVDLLHPVDGGYEIYEVKATTEPKEEHLPDAAFQRYVLEKAGVRVVGTYLMTLNKEYRRKGDLDLKALFNVTKLDENSLFAQALGDIPNDLSDMEAIYASKKEPDVPLSSVCKDCPFHDHCHRDLPKPSVLDINGLRGYDWLAKGVVTYVDLLASTSKLNQRQMVQIDSYIKGKGLIIDLDGIQGFLQTIRYPIYHLDFESIQLPIPPADETWPYEQIPTQYSLHIEYADGRLEHKEFLGDDIDPRRAIAEALCRDIPKDGCVMVYNQTFEKSRLKELADLFPDLRDHLTSMMDNIVDLIEPFKKGYYYMAGMGGSNSIKAVLPALYPNDPELDYHALPVVHHGAEAMEAYVEMLEADPKEKQRIRDGLLKYCCLDTLAMVKVLRKVREAASGKP